MVRFRLHKALPFEVASARLALSNGVAAGDARGDRLLVNWDEGYVSFVLLRGGEPLLVRTLPGEDAPEMVARQIVGTLQFHRDRLGGQAIDEIVVRSAA